LTFIAIASWHFLFSVDDILRNWPELSREAVEEAIRWAADLVHQQYPGKKMKTGKPREFAHTAFSVVRLQDQNCAYGQSGAC
jgi:hypothetical protein